MSKVLSIRVDDSILELINKMISYKIAKNKKEAVYIIMEKGINNVYGIIENKDKISGILNSYIKNGLPELPGNLSDISIEERE